MNRLWDALARLVVWAVLDPMDRRYACRFSNEASPDDDAH